jgi:hypothetical protein
VYVVGGSSCGVGEQILGAGARGFSSIKVIMDEGRHSESETATRSVDLTVSWAEED